MVEPIKVDDAISEKHERRDSLQWCKYSRRVALNTIVGRSDRGVGIVGERVVVGGWVKSCKEVRKTRGGEGQGQGERRVQPVGAPPSTDLTCSEVLMNRVPFLRSIARLLVGPLLDNEVLPQKPTPSIACARINDGSCTASFQIIIDPSICPVSQVISVGTSIYLEGTIHLKKLWTPGRHAIELVAEKILHIGSIDAGRYPLAKKRLSLDYLRLHPHLRPRTTMIASITRIRNGLTHSTHEFFKTNGFINVQMPVISSNSGEDPGRTFQVTTLSDKSHGIDDASNMGDGDTLTIESVQAAIREKSKRIEQLKRSNSNRDVLLSALDDLKNANELSSRLLERRRKGNLEPRRLAKFDSSGDLFSSRHGYLCRTAALHLETHSCSLASVYALGPVFQAEETQKRKDLAEMWVLDVNLAFAESEDAMACAEDFLNFVGSWVLQNYPDDLKFISERVDKDCTQRLRSMQSSGPFERITYTEAIDALKKSQETTSGVARIEWGSSLSEEQERYLAESIFKRPVVIHDHPKDLKPFFLRLKDDLKTVSSFDVILPKVGALIRGGQNEERLDVISKRIEEMALPREQYDWYIDLRRHGSVKHSGFSLGIEHLVMFVTGVEDARDVIAFPVTS